MYIVQGANPLNNNALSIILLEHSVCNVARYMWLAWMLKTNFHSGQVSMKQSLLFDGCCKLAFQVELVQWCLEKAR